jgi:DNA-binding NtrC family response regulator
VLLMKNEFIIFYADDDQEDLDYFTEIVELINEDITVVTQKNGKQLLYALDNPPPIPHIVFLDIKYARNEWPGNFRKCKIFSTT